MNNTPLQQAVFTGGRMDGLCILVSTGEEGWNSDGYNYRRTRKKDSEGRVIFACINERIVKEKRTLQERQADFNEAQNRHLTLINRAIFGSSTHL